MSFPSPSFWHKGYAPGVILFAFSLIAIAFMNSPIRDGFIAVLGLEVGAGPLRLTLSDWVKEGLMALFFLYVSLELKRELTAGVLARPKDAALPAMAALGGMIVPALIYAAINLNTGYMHGWAVPVATDIAFALGVLSLLGKKASPSLKAFLLALAIADDLGAMMVIAFGYTSHIDAPSLGFVVALFSVMMLANRMGMRRLEFYWVLGACLWAVMLHSGVHATVAGVLTAFAIPFRKGTAETMERQPLVIAEHALQPWTQFLIMPLFALCFAGIDFGSLDMSLLLHPVTLGVLAGLLIGKPLGVLGACYLFRVASGKALDLSWAQLAGAGLLAGIGFTMSLFIGGLAFDDPAMADHVRVGVYGGSILAGVLGFALLATTQRKGQG